MADTTLESSLNSYVRLTHLSALDIMGADAETFLQGQTSTQVNLANGRFAPLTCFCTPKGRMLANAQLVRLTDTHFRLIMHASLVDSLANHLTKFAAFYRAELITQPSLYFMGANAHALSLAQTLDIALPTQLNTQSGHERALALQWPGSPHPRWLFCLQDNVMSNIEDTERARNAWYLEDIRSGIAWVTQAQQDRYLPQMFNWEALGGISFKKGCYTGQEVVARAHFRGQVKKRMARFSCTTATLPAPGDTLVDTDDKSLGEVISSAFNASQNAEFLAVVNTKIFDDEPALFWQQQPISLATLPYVLERIDPEQMALTINA